MGTYEHQATVHDDAGTLFAYLAEVSHLPEYFTAMQSAETAGPGEVHVVAEVEGVRREGTAWFEVDEASKTMRWGSEGPNNYGGDLTVASADSGTSTVTVTLHTERADGPGIRAGLEQTLAEIKRRVEGRSTEPAD